MQSLKSETKTRRGCIVTTTRYRAPAGGIVEHIELACPRQIDFTPVKHGRR